MSYYDNQRSIQVYEKRARKYDKLIEGLGYAIKLRNMARSLPIDIPINSKILDLGCGTGLVTEELKLKYPDSDIIGLEASEEMLKILNKKLPDIGMILGDFNRPETFRSLNKPIDLKESSFNLIISTGAIDYANLHIVIPFVYDLLKKNGFFVIRGISKNLFGYIIGKIWYFKPHGKHKVASACKDHGFSKLRIIPITPDLIMTNFIHYNLIAQK